MSRAVRDIIFTDGRLTERMRHEAPSVVAQLRGDTGWTHPYGSVARRYVDRVIDARRDGRRGPIEATAAQRRQLSADELIAICRMVDRHVDAHCTALRAGIAQLDADRA